MTLSEIPTAELREELLRRNAAREHSADARIVLALVTRAGMSYGLTPAQVLSKRRPLPYCYARWAVSSALAHAGWLPSRIAAVFRIDRGTVANGLLRAGKLVASDSTFLGTLILLREELAATSSMIASNQ